MKMIKTILYSLSLLLLPLVSFAQTETIASELDSFYNSAIAIGGVAAVVMIIVGGIFFSVSGGSADKKSEGKKYITSALWGLVLLLGAFLILNTINPELTTLEAPAPPQAEVLQGASCSANSGLDECSENQTPYGPDGDLQCCVDTGAPEQAESCREEVPDEFEHCETQNSEKRELESDETFLNVFNCSASPDVDMGIHCQNQIYWINDGGGDPMNQRLELEEGSKTWWRVAYPQNGEPEDAKCGMFAWEDSDGNRDQSNVTGLLECND